MKTLLKNNRLFLNLLLLTGAVFFFSSCAREKASLSYNNEKLKKQSLELENSQSLNVPTQTSGAIATKVVETVKTNETSTTSENTKSTSKIATEKNNTKLSPVQKMVMKKVAKKMSPEQLEGTDATQQLDKNLKIALILGAVGLILSFFGYPFYVIGGILVIVALVFLILWLLEQ